MLEAFRIFVLLTVSVFHCAKGVSSPIALDGHLQNIIKDTGLSPRDVENPPPIQLTKVEVSVGEKHADYFQYQMLYPHLGAVRFLIKGPKGFMDPSQVGQKRKVLVVAAGIRSGQDTVKLLSANNDWIVAGFEYAETASSLSADPSKVARFVRFSSVHLALVLSYLARQPWVERLGVVGVSLGGLILPSALRLSEFLGDEIRSSVFAYTGAEIESLIQMHLPKEVPPFLREGLAKLVAHLTRDFDPRVHLPKIKSSNLVIRASAEEVFTRDSWELLERLLPQPKSIRLVQGPHINEEQKLMILQTESIILNWLAHSEERTGPLP